MTTETKLRIGLVMSLLGLITMTFFYFQQQDDLQRYKDDGGFLQGGDIEKAETQELVENTEFLTNINGRIESGIYCYLDDSSHVEMKKDKNFISKFSKEERVIAIKKIESLRLEYDYPLTSWIFAFEIYKIENPKIAKEIDEFIGHLTE
jgi:hypothetical protein